MATTSEEQQISEQGEAQPEPETTPATGEGETAAAEAKSSGGSSPSDMIEFFNTTIQEYDATFVVYYRGLW